MLQGISIAIQGMSAMLQKQDQISNNLANINTTGFKESNLFIRSYNRYVNNSNGEVYVNREIKPDEVYVNYAQGPIKKSGGKLDLAIHGSGFFTVFTPHGVRFTRNGNFSIDSEGFLVTSEGYKVMGKKGFIKLDDTKNITINSSGTVYQDNNEIGELRITDFKKPYKLLREGNSLFNPKIPDAIEIVSPGYEIKQGFLEMSNANPIKNMVEMIKTLRNYEAEQKVLQAHDQTLEKSVNSVGRLD